MTKHPTKDAYCAGCGTVFQSRNRGQNRGWTRFCGTSCAAKTIHFKGGPAAGRRRRRYGLEPEQHEKLLKDQDYRCALCRGKPDYGLYVDHHHESKKVRSLLCARCNTAVGVFDQLTWDEVLVFWGYSTHHEAGIEMAREMAAAAGEDSLYADTASLEKLLAIACRETGNHP